MLPGYQIQADKTLENNQLLSSPMTFLRLSSRIETDNIDIQIDQSLGDQTLILSGKMFDLFKQQLNDIMSLNLD